MTNVEQEEFLQRIDLPDGRRIVILNWDGMDRLDAARNLYLMDRDGNPVWQVRSAFDSDGGPFTRVELHGGGKFDAHRWDGGIYEIDAETGFAAPKSFEK